MSEYFIKQECELEDGLLGGGEFPVKVDNISLTSGAEVERGYLLAGVSGVYSLAGSGDVDKPRQISLPTALTPSRRHIPPDILIAKR